jgi:hypothetical protein
MGMKCIQCGTDNLLKDRTNHAGRCKNCNHPFVFEPTIVQNKLAFTDPFFQKAISDISTQNILFFTPKQFQYFLDRRLKAKARYSLTSFSTFFSYFSFGFVITLTFGRFLGFILQSLRLGILAALSIYTAFWISGFFKASQSSARDIQDRNRNARNLQILGVIILVIGIPWSIINRSIIGYFVAGLLGAASYWLGIWQKIRLRGVGETFLVSKTQSQNWLQRWQQVNGRLEKLLPLPQVTTLPVSVSSEVSNYSFDRVIVCEEEAIAQFLIANNVHFENNCAILSITGYPQNIFDTVMTMLRRNPDLKVYALHNASPAGVSLVYQLKNSSDWFADQSVAVFDLGVSPRQVLASRNIFVQLAELSAQAGRRLPEAVRQSLTPLEVQWLEEGRFVELESFAPQRLLRVVNLGIAQSDNPQSNDSLTILDDRSMYGGDYVFVFDSFG